MSQTLNFHNLPTSSNWSRVVQGVTDNQQNIELWEKRLEEINKKKKNFLDNKYYNPEREGHKNRLKTLNEKIEMCEKLIQQLNEELLDEEDDDEW
jgi:hypothetical protein